MKNELDRERVNDGEGSGPMPPECNGRWCNVSFQREALTVNAEWRTEMDQVLGWYRSSLGSSEVIYPQGQFIGDTPTAWDTSGVIHPQHGVVQGWYILSLGQLRSDTPSAWGVQGWYTLSSGQLCSDIPSPWGSSGVIQSQHGAVQGWYSLSMGQFRGSSSPIIKIG